jgi:hypothetical protein
LINRALLAVVPLVKLWLFVTRLRALPAIVANAILGHSIFADSILGHSILAHSERACKSQCHRKAENNPLRHYISFLCLLVSRALG